MQVYDFGNHCKTNIFVFLHDRSKPDNDIEPDQTFRRRKNRARRPRGLRTFWFIPKSPPIRARPKLSNPRPHRNIVVSR